MRERHVWHLMTLVVALSFCPLSFGQVTIKIRVINADNGRAIQKQPISVSMLYEKNEKTPPKYDATLLLETDANGEAQFVLPEPAPAHLSAHVGLTSQNLRCGCVALVTTEDLIQKGISVPHFGTGAKGSANRIETEPRQMIFFARPLTFFEKLVAPFVRE